MMEAMPDLPRLRMNLDFMPSPAPDRPGLFIRDPYHYSDAALIVPPLLVSCLQCFDGNHTDLDLRVQLTQATGDLQVSDLVQHLLDTLSQAGFLDDARYAEMREARERAFAESPKRAPAHAGAAYPDDPDALRGTMERYLNGPVSAAASDSDLTAIAAPHVSPEGGWQSYRAAYAGLGGQLAARDDRVFVILGTSHYGQPERFGLTRKSFVTPWGEAPTEVAMVDELASRAGSAVTMEDYCHSVEHSIEFQVVFLQHLFGPNISILPILCGPFARSLYHGGMPEASEEVGGFLDALGELAARESRRLFWVLGVDMAHMGRRYGDSFSALADRGEMADVADRDRGRIERINAGDARGFWELVQSRQDDLKWCGASPFYTFMKAVPTARGQLARYEQWNIDDQSVVSFAGMRFYQ